MANTVAANVGVNASSAGNSKQCAAQAKDKPTAVVSMVLLSFILSFGGLLSCVICALLADTVQLKLWAFKKITGLLYTGF